MKLNVQPREIRLLAAVAALAVLAMATDVTGPGLSCCGEEPDITVTFVNNYQGNITTNPLTGEPALPNILVIVVDAKLKPTQKKVQFSMYPNTSETKTLKGGGVFGYVVVEYAVSALLFGPTYVTTGTILGDSTIEIN